MKYLLITTTILISFTAAAQSPSLSILVKMDSIKTESTRYKIEMNICEPKKKTERRDWFTSDTSTIDFALLKANDIECGGYFDKGTPTLISGEEKDAPFNQFNFSGQVFAWEKIFVFKISNYSSRGWIPEMYVVMPMKYKSFVTNISLIDIEFHSGKVIFLADFKTEQKGIYLTIEQSLKDYKSVEMKNFPLKAIL